MMSGRERPTYKQRLRAIFHRVFPARDYDTVTGLFSGRRLTIPENPDGLSDMEYLNDPITMLTSFLEINNKRHDQYAPQSFLNNIVLQNLLAWDTHKAKGFALPFYVIISALIFVCEALSTLIGLTTNIAKIVTEFIPALIITSIEALLENTNPLTESKSRFKRFLGYAASFALFPFYALANIWYFLGSAITSPLDNLRKLRQQYHERKRNVLTAVILGVISLSTSVAVLFAILPYAIKVGMLYIVSTVANHMVHLLAAKMISTSTFREAMSTTISYASQKFVKILAPILQKIRKGFHIAADHLVDRANDAYAAVIHFFRYNKNQITVPPEAEPRPRTAIVAYLSTDNLVAATLLSRAVSPASSEQESNMGLSAAPSTADFTSRAISRSPSPPKSSRDVPDSPIHSHASLPPLAPLTKPITSLYSGRFQIKGK